MIRSFAHAEFPLARLLERKRETVTVVLPAREVADTVGSIVERILGLGDLVDQLLVVDAASRDGTADIAAAAGAEVVQEASLVPELGPVLGKGDAMWRALEVARGDLVAYLDSDTRDFPAHFVTGMVGPLLAGERVEFVKGAFERPFTDERGSTQRGGGRVTELSARPLLSAFYPELATFSQPLAGEVAARRSLLERIPFATGYAVETAMLLDVRGAVGVDAMCEVDLGERLNRHQPLSDLGPMAYAVLRTVLERLRDEGRLLDGHAPPLQTAEGRLVQVETVRRPPYGSLRARTARSLADPMGLRCVYTDLDGTLLGAGASLFHTGDGAFTLLPARALEACHRAGVEVVCVSGRRRAQVMEDARLIGQSSYVFEVGSGVVVDGEARWLVGPFEPADGLDPHALIERSGAPDLLLRALDGALEVHAPWHLGREVSHVFRGQVEVERANELLTAEGHGELKLIDNGEIEDGRRCYHLIPAAASKAAAVELHMRARGLIGAECIAVGDSREDLGIAPLVGRFFLVANAGAGVEAGAGGSVERTEAGHGEGFYEAVVRALAETR